MTKLGNNQIERLAVDAVVREANRPFSCLVPNIPVGDKGVSFDGDITVFIDSGEKVESYLGKVPVQIKGTQVKDFSIGNRTFNFPLKHYRNYYRNKGVLLLVVEIKEDGSSKIYYKQLLPKEISKILNFYEIKKKQGSKSLELRPLEETNLTVACRNFLDTQDKQHISLIENKEYSRKIFPEYSISSLTFDPIQEPTSNIFDHDFFIYGIEGTTFFPLEICRIDSISTTNTESMTVDGEFFDFLITSTDTEDTHTRLIENVLEVIVDKKTNTFNAKFLKFHSLASMLKILNFLKERLYDNILPIPNDDFRFGPKSQIEKWREHVDFLHLLVNDLQRFYKDLNISESLLINEIDPYSNIIEQFRNIIRCYLHGETHIMALSSPDVHRMISFRAGDRLFILFYQPDQDKKLINAFSDEMLKKRVQIKEREHGDSFQHSIYIRLNLEALSFGVNINYRNLRFSFDEFDPFINDLVRNITIDFCLQCIKAYDISKNIELLDIVEYILNKYQRSSTYDIASEEFAIVYVNQLQVKKRKEGTLTTEEYEILIDIKNRFQMKDFIPLHFCCNVLLESIKEAQLSFLKMDEELQNYYKTMPIYFLYSELS